MASAKSGVSVAAEHRVELCSLKPDVVLLIRLCVHERLGQAQRPVVRDHGARGLRNAGARERLAGTAEHLRHRGFALGDGLVGPART